MSWRNSAEWFYEGWPEKHKERMLSTVAEENDLAESLGFCCKRDDRRGYGWCFFEKGKVRVWQTADGWARATLSRGKVSGHRYYHTLSQALRDESPRAHRDRFGEMYITKSPAAVAHG